MPDASSLNSNNNYPPRLEKLEYLFELVEAEDMPEARNSTGIVANAIEIPSVKRATL
jgi:hypothetical protein